MTARYLKQDGSNHIYVYDDALAARADMHECDKSGNLMASPDQVSDEFTKEFIVPDGDSPVLHIDRLNMAQLLMLAAENKVTVPRQLKKVAEVREFLKATMIPRFDPEKDGALTLDDEQGEG